MSLLVSQLNGFNAYQEAGGGALPVNDMYAHYKADFAYTDAGKSTLCSSSGSDTVYTWEDKSGNGRDLIQSTSGSRPKWYNTGPNSKPFLRFDGSDDYLSSVWTSESQAITVYLLLLQTSWVAADRIYTMTTGTGFFGLDQRGSSPELKTYAGGIGDAITGVTLSNWKLVAMVYDGLTDSKFKVDNNSTITGSCGGTAGLAGTMNFGSSESGGSQCAEFDCCEAVFYLTDHNFTSGSGLLARQYFNSKYNLGLGI